MAFSETTKAVEAAKRQPKGGVIKKINDGLAARKSSVKPVDAVQESLPGTEGFEQPHLSDATKALLEPHFKTIQSRAKLSKREADEHKKIVDSMIGDGCKAGQRAHFKNGAYIELVESPAKLEGRYVSPKPKKEKKAKKSDEGKDAGEE